MGAESQSRKSFGQDDVFSLQSIATGCVFEGLALNLR